MTNTTEPLYLGGKHVHSWKQMPNNMTVSDGRKVEKASDWEQCHCGRLRRLTTIDGECATVREIKV